MKFTGSKWQVRWLYTLIILIMAIVIVGGATRLTQSGLSMVTWQPIRGVMPPLNASEWQSEFGQYKAYPEFQIRNPLMTVDQFKTIYYWEYSHRLLGRIIGLAALIPFLVFLFRKSLTSFLKRRGVMIIVGIGLQGLLGWYMVKSGLTLNPYVSHYRLAAHLILAFMLIALIFDTVLKVRGTSEDRMMKRTVPKLVKSSIYFGGILLTTQIIYGAFTAGLKAGHMMNTFPKMGSYWIAPEAFQLSPSLIHNILENPFMVQFIHRGLGISVLIWSLLLLTLSYRYQLDAKIHNTLLLMTGGIMTQFLLGVLTLILKVPIILAIGHQFGALCLVGLGVYLVHVMNVKVKENDYR